VVFIVECWKQLAQNIPIPLSVKRLLRKTIGPSTGFRNTANRALVLGASRRGLSALHRYYSSQRLGLSAITCNVIRIFRALYIYSLFIFVATIIIISFQYQYPSFGIYAVENILILPSIQWLYSPNRALASSFEVS
jgi:hypothetical protein